MLGFAVFGFIVVAVVLAARHLTSDGCPRCGVFVNYDYHGYNTKYAHCRNCGHCTLKGCEQQ